MGPCGWAALPGHLPHRSSSEVLGRLAPLRMGPCGCSLVLIKYHKLRINSCQKQMFSHCPVVNTNALRRKSWAVGEMCMVLQKPAVHMVEPVACRTAWGRGGTLNLMAMPAAAFRGNTKSGLANRGEGGLCPHPSTH